MKKYIRFFALIMCLVHLSASYAYANVVTYELTEAFPVNRGVTYQKIRQITQAGLRDIHVIEIEATDPYITLNPVESKKEISFKEPLTTLLRDNGAIAGINADFFGMAGSYSAAFGPVIRNGSFVSANSVVNSSEPEYASFFIDNDDIPFLDFIKTDITFYNNGKSNIHIHAVNKVTDMVLPIILTTEGATDTKSIDERFPNLFKITIEDSVITHISAKGEWVNVPANGYVVVIKESTASTHLPLFQVGDSASLVITSKIDFSHIQTAIGGAGLILKDGEVSDIGVIISGRHPRSAIGINKEKTKIYLVAVDGRSHSIGANHEEMAEIMLRLGCHDAMHFDGGGSTTLAVSRPASALSVVNTPSDGVQRHVINGLGVFNTAPLGEATEIAVRANDSIIYTGVGNVIDVHGSDTYYREVHVPTDETEIHIDDTGYFEDGLYYTETTGDISVTADYGDITVETVLVSRRLAELVPDKPKIRAFMGDNIKLNFIGIDETGFESKVTAPMEFTVVPAGAGVVKDNHFRPLLNTDGYIECRLGDIVCYIEFQIGGDLQLVEPFEGSKSLLFEGTPDDVSGSVAHVNDLVYDGNFSARLTYNFPASDETQTAHMLFESPIEFEGEPMAIQMQVHGDTSRTRLRGHITDADGKSVNIDFSNEIDWEDWKLLRADLPSGLAYPIELERIFLVSASNPQFLTDSIYIDNITAMYPRLPQNLLIPMNSKFKDPFLVPFSDTVSEGTYDITALGRTMYFNAKPATHGMYINRITDIAAANTSYVIYAGETESPLDIDAAAYKWSDSYNYYSDENITIIRMFTKDGSIAAADPWQLARMNEDILKGGENVIIMLDLDPLKLESRRESALFTDALSRLADDGFTIFVVSAAGFYTEHKLLNAVRYINLGALWTIEDEKNDDFRVLRFRVSRNEMRYEFKPVD